MHKRRIDAGFFADLVQKIYSLLQAVQKRQADVLADDLPRQPGKSRAGADVYDLRSAQPAGKRIRHPERQAGVQKMLSLNAERIGYRCEVDFFVPLAKKLGVGFKLRRLCVSYGDVLGRKRLFQPCQINRCHARPPFSALHPCAAAQAKPKAPTHPRDSLPIFSTPALCLRGEP